MPIDPYSLCPGGTGKKVKFCCSDLVAELDKIDRMLQGEQRVACLDFVEKLLAKYPHRACLLATKATLHSELDQTEKAKQTLDQLLARHADNPVGLAELAVLKVDESGGRAAIDLLQRAVAASSEQMSSQVYHALSYVAQGLLHEGEVLAARGHLLLMLSIGGVDREPVLAALTQVNGMTGIPLCAKQLGRLKPCPADASYQRSFDIAYEAAARGRWRDASEKFYELISRVGDQPAIWANLAVLRSWLGDSPGAIRALRKFAAQKVPLDDAVDAEALAQWLESRLEPADALDAIEVDIPVTDHERFAEIVAGNSRLPPLQVDLSQAGSGDEPPPRAAFSLLDRVMPTTGVGLTRDAVPNVVGEVLWFGKQTDRAERIELLTLRGDKQALAIESLREIFGSAIGDATSETAVSKVDAVAQAMGFDWRFPTDTPEELRAQLVSEQHEAAINENWPKLKLRLFGGRSAEEVASDPKERVKLLAAILNLELLSSAPESFVGATKLRQRFHLPQPEPVDINNVPIEDISLSRLCRLNPKNLSTAALVKAYVRSLIYHATSAIKLLAEELVERQDLPTNEFSRADLFAELAQFQRHWRDSVALLDRARESAAQEGRSSARYDLAELNLHLLRYDAENSQRLLLHIQQEHLREPGVAYALQNLLASLGILGPASQGARPEEPATAAVAASTEEPGRIWTPGAEPVASASKKSAIWTPDLD